MTQTTPGSGIRGSRRFVLMGGSVTNASGTTDITTYVIGTSTAGMAMGSPFRVTKIEAFANVTADSADGTFTFTAYKGSVSAGTRALEGTLVLTAIAEVTGSSTTVVNAGLDRFTGTDQLIVRWFYDGAADSVSMSSIQVRVHCEWDD